MSVLTSFFIIDDNLVTSDTSSIDNMLSEEGSVGTTSTSNALKCVCFTITFT